MSAFDDYLQLLNNNPKMDATKQWANKIGNNVKTGIDDSLPKGTGPDAMLDYASNVNPIAGLAGNILSWHGSPHKFSKFENKAIGTGEGAQYFGMGHYSGEAVNALDSQYRRYLSELRHDPLESFLSDPKHTESLNNIKQYLKNSISKDYPNFNNMSEAEQRVLHMKTYNDTVRDIFRTGQYYNKNDPMGQHARSWESGFSDIGNDLFKIARNYNAPVANQGYLYQLNLKPDKEDLLNLNLPMSEQSPRVISAMNQLGEKNIDMSGFNSRMADSAYDKLRNYHGDSKLSELLLSRGVPGHAFAGQGGKGLDNYVMYNPDDMQIIRRIKSGLDNPIESFRSYPKSVHQAVNDFGLNSADVQPRTLVQKLKELSNNKLKDIEW